MKAVLAPTVSIQARTSFATNSGPLSLRTNAGGPRRMNRSVSASMTSVEFSLRLTRIVRHSRLNSSRMFNVRNAFGFDDPFDPGQVFRKMAAVAFRHAALGSTLPLKCASRLLRHRVQQALRQRDICEREIELLRVELLGPPPELLPTQFADDALQTFLGLDRIRQRRLGLGEAGLQKRVLFGQGGVGHGCDQAHGRDHHHRQIIAESLCRSYTASSGRRTRSGRTSRQSRPSNSAENCAGDIFITPSCALGQTNFAPSRRLWTSTMPV